MNNMTSTCSPTSPVSAAAASPAADDHHACSTCGKVFARKYNMKVHEITHMKVSDRPFGCPHCNERFVQRSNLKRHLRRRHQLPYSCPKCRFRAATREGLTEHARTVHNSKDCQPRMNPAGRSYACPCKVRFKTYEDLDNHQKECTGVTSRRGGNGSTAPASPSSSLPPPPPPPAASPAVSRRRAVRSRRTRPRPAPVAVVALTDAKAAPATEPLIAAPPPVTRSRSKKRKPVRFRSHSTEHGSHSSSPRRKAQRCLDTQKAPAAAAALPLDFSNIDLPPLSPSPGAEPLPVPGVPMAAPSPDAGAFQALLSLAGMSSLAHMPQLMAPVPRAQRIPPMVVRDSSVDSDRTETESVHSASSPPASPTSTAMSTLSDTDIEDDGASSPVPPPISISLPPASASASAARSASTSPGRVPAPRNTDPFCQTNSMLGLDENIDDSIDTLLGLKTPTATPCAPSLPMTSYSTMSLLNGSSSCEGSTLSTASIINDSMLSCTSGAAPSTTPASLLLGGDSMLSCSGPSTASLLNGPSLSAGPLSPMTPVAIMPAPTAAAPEECASAASATDSSVEVSPRPLQVPTSRPAEVDLSDFDIPSLRTPPMQQQQKFFAANMPAAPAASSPCITDLPSPNSFMPVSPPSPFMPVSPPPPSQAQAMSSSSHSLHSIMSGIPAHMRQQCLTQAISHLQRTHPEVVAVLRASVVVGNALSANTGSNPVLDALFRPAPPTPSPVHIMPPTPSPVHMLPTHHHQQMAGLPLYQLQ